MKFNISKTEIKTLKLQPEASILKPSLNLNIKISFLMKILTLKFETFLKSNKKIASVKFLGTNPLFLKLISQPTIIWWT